MKVLSVRQPWADLLVQGAKRYETRSWSTPYRGRLAIHASARMTEDERSLARDVGFDPDDLALGAIVGTVMLFAVHRTGDLEVAERELLLGDFSPGRYAWQVTAAHPLARPLPAKGRLGLWAAPQGLVAP